MTPCMSWKNDEIERLRTDFLKGLPIKMIARALQRTPGSVNKALSRFRIRTPRLLKKPVRLEPTKPRKKLYKDVNQKACLAWTSFNAILAWLKEEGIEVSHPSDDSYFLEGRPLSKMQIVMCANKIRLEKKLTIFLVEDITW